MPDIHSIGQFTYDKATSILVAEASSLGIRACDPVPTTVSIQGRHRLLDFSHRRTSTDGEGDVVYWEFAAPGTPFKLHLLND